MWHFAVTHVRCMHSMRLGPKLPGRRRPSHSASCPSPPGIAAPLEEPPRHCLKCLPVACAAGRPFKTCVHWVHTPGRRPASRAHTCTHTHTRARARAHTHAHRRPHPRLMPSPPCASSSQPHLCLGACNQLVQRRHVLHHCPHCPAVVDDERQLFGRGGAAAHLQEAGSAPGRHLGTSFHSQMQHRRHGPRALPTSHY
jgi:hypothetical protein